MMTELTVGSERAPGWRCQMGRRRRFDDAKLELERKMQNVISNLFRENSRYIQKINVDSSCVPRSSRIRENSSGIQVINKMVSSRWHSKAVDDLLDHLVCNKEDFSIVMAFGENETSANYDFDLFLDFRFSWRGTGFVCVVEESTNGYQFPKDLVMVDNNMRKKDCFVVSEKRKDLCIVMDGEQIQLETRHENSFVSVWHYCGNENDPRSRHWNSPLMLTVLGFKLKSINSDVTKCLGATNPTTVALFNADIPDHGPVIRTKVDYRFFYLGNCRGCSTFESTQFENHYLAVKDSDVESVSPYLYLKEITEGKEYDEEILFQIDERKVHPNDE